MIQSKSYIQRCHETNTPTIKTHHKQIELNETHYSNPTHPPRASNIPTATKRKPHITHFLKSNMHISLTRIAGFKDAHASRRCIRWPRFEYPPWGRNPRPFDDGLRDGHGFDGGMMGWWDGGMLYLDEECVGEAQQCPVWRRWGIDLMEICGKA